MQAETNLVHLGAEMLEEVIAAEMRVNGDSKQSRYLPISDYTQISLPAASTYISSSEG